MRTEELLYGKYVEHVIIAPHCDDEFIGCFEILVHAHNVTVLVQDMVSASVRLNETLKCLKEISSTQFDGRHKVAFKADITNVRYSGSVSDCRTIVYWFPDPVHEHHPAHKLFTPKLQATLSSNVQLRTKECCFGLYSTNMKVPYLHELSVVMSAQKEKLSKLFKSQKGYFAKHNDSFFFEGRIML